MRYLKVLVFVIVFFISMIFFFQNQASLASEMVLHLNLFFIDPMESMPFPFYFVVLASFLLGALLAVLGLIWDRMSLSAKCMQATWRVRTLEKELAEYKKEEVKALPLIEEAKEEVKAEVKEEVKEEPQAEVKEEVKEEIKDEKKS